MEQSSDYSCKIYRDNYKLITVDLSKQKVLDADPRWIQQIVFQENAGGVGNTRMRLYWKIKRNSFRVVQNNSWSSVNNINGWLQ